MVITKSDWKINIFGSLIFLIILMLISIVLWFYVPDLGIGIAKSGRAMLVIQGVLLFFMTLSFIVFYGSFMEFYKQRPGIITLGIAVVSPLIFMKAIDMFSKNYLIAYGIGAILAVTYYFISRGE